MWSAAVYAPVIIGGLLELHLRGVGHGVLHAVVQGPCLSRLSSLAV